MIMTDGIATSYKLNGYKDTTTILNANEIHKQMLYMFFYGERKFSRYRYLILWEILFIFSF